jgi:diguanylate cyclase (GGDEF)-like protein/PAS domain S-box-containing protein
MDWRKFTKLTPLSIAFLYLLSGGVWFGFSHAFIHTLTQDTQLQVFLESNKDWVFIGINALFFYWLMVLSIRSLRDSKNELTRSYADLEFTHEALVLTQEKLKEQFRDIQEREAYYRGIYEGISSGIFVHDQSGCLVHANASAWNLLGVEKDALNQRSQNKEQELRRYRVGNERFNLTELIQYLLQKENLHQSIEVVIIGGVNEQRKWLLAQSDIILSPSNAEEIVTTFIEHTVEKKLEISNGILNEINQLVLKNAPFVHIEQTLCDRLVEELDFAFAWIGSKEEDGSVRFRAKAGVKGVEDLIVRWDDSVYAQGAGGRAIRLGVPQTSIVDGNLFYSIWADFFAVNGIHSVAAFPLIHKGEVTGAFALASHCSDFFEPKMIAAFEHWSIQIAMLFNYAQDRNHLERFRILSEHADETILFIRPDGQVIDANEAAVRMFGYTHEEWLKLNVLKLRLSEEREKAKPLLQIAQQGLTIECNHLHKDGHSFPVEMSSKSLRFGGESIILAIIRDISERVENRMSLEENETRYREMFEHMRNAVEVYEVVGEAETFIFKEYNSAAERLGHLSREKVLGKSIYEVFPDAMEDGFVELLRRVWKAGKSEYRRFCFYDEEGAESWRDVYVYKLPSGELVSIHEDITLRKLAEEKVWHQAHHDSLTQLPNRILFYEHLQKALDVAQKENLTCAVLFLDLDRFKLINDTMGHNSGDSLLIKVSERLRQILPQEATIGRQGGDEFIILLPFLIDKTDAALMAHKILKAFRKPYQLDSQEVFVTTSIGISLYPQDTKEMETLVKQADTAMYYAKEQGGNNYQFYTEELNHKAQERLELEISLRKALERKEFISYYQPLLDMESGEIVGFESLSRWESPERGIVSPNVFIPIAEETGIIIPMGERGLRHACRQNLLWQKRGYPPRRIAVNISARQFREPQFVDMVESILKETGLDPKWLELEITESIAMEQGEESVQQLQKLKEFGIQIAIDDFGTGYSSLNSLRRLPIDILKIDQSFIREIGKGSSGEAIIRTIIQMAKDLNLRVVAEGVETIEQLEFLRKHNCDEIQGYLISKPLPLEELEVLLQTHEAERYSEQRPQKNFRTI